MIKYLTTLPTWLVWALLETHVIETPGTGSTPRILEYFKISRIGLAPNDATAWCAIAANAAFEANGIPGTRSAMARSFERDPNFVKLDGPTRGAVATFWRDDIKAGIGHTGFYIGENKAGTHVLICGGNQSDKFSLAWFAKSKVNWGLVGYYYPAGLPLPLIGRRVVAGSPAVNNGKVT